MKEQNTGEIDNLQKNVERVVEILNREIDLADRCIKEAEAEIKDPGIFSDVDNLKLQSMVFREKLGLATYIKAILEQ